MFKVKLNEHKKIFYEMEDAESAFKVYIKVAQLVETTLNEVKVTNSNLFYPFYADM